MSTQIPENEKVKASEHDIAAEFAELGKKLRNTINTAWTSEERVRLQKEVEEGLVRLRNELNTATKNIRETETAQKVETEVKKFREEIDSGKVSDDIRKGLVTGLRTVGEALDKLADKFTPISEEPKK
jgi:DNA mismatch repair ATPase MutS